ncbi:hypothetical protein ACO0R3_001904 [Hanseniaspora guilliermondii]
MSSNNKKSNKSRIEKDLQKIYKSGRFKVFFEDDSNLKEFQIEIKGPDDSLYKDSYYRLNFMIPDEYPFKSPSVAFGNKIFHPNIEFCSGSICLNTLNKNWAAIYDLLNVVDVMIPQLLINPNPNDPFNVEASRMFTSDMDLYKFEVQRCIQNHACREAYERKFYREGFDLEQEKEDHPYYYSKNKNNQKNLNSSSQIVEKTLTKNDAKSLDLRNTEEKTPYLEMESSVGLFSMESSRTPPVLHRPTSSGFKKVRSFTSFKKNWGSDEIKPNISSHSTSFNSLSNSKKSHSLDHNLFDLDKKECDYLYKLGFSTKKTDDIINSFSGI